MIINILLWMCFLFALKDVIVKWNFVLINQQQIEILYWLINNALSYSAAYFENKTVIILWRERGIKENSSGLIIQVHYWKFMFFKHCCNPCYLLIIVNILLIIQNLSFQYYYAPQFTLGFIFLHYLKCNWHTSPFGFVFLFKDVVPFRNSPAILTSFVLRKDVETMN